MIRPVWSVLCQSASFDVQTNNVSLFNILEQITVFGEPSASKAAIIQAELVSLWARENIETPTTGQMRVYYIDPNGNHAVPLSLEINLSQANYHRTRINMSGFPIIAKGEYNFYIEYQVQGDEQWKLAAKIPLMVLAQEPIPQ